MELHSYWTDSAGTEGYVKDRNRKCQKSWSPRTLCSSFRFSSSIPKLLWLSRVTSSKSHSLPPSLKELKLFGPSYMEDLVRGTINAQARRLGERQNLHSVNSFFCWLVQDSNSRVRTSGNLFPLCRSLGPSQLH
jgi:hypothetical protein